MSITKRPIIVGALAGMVLSVLSHLPSLSAGHGGHNPTFDPNSFGGSSGDGWTCIRTQASGACGGSTFSSYWNAACDGTTIDSAAFASWVSHGVGLGTAQAKLYIPPGSNCVLDGTGTNGGITFDASVHNTAGIQNVVIWGYGATVNNCGVLGGWGLYSNNTTVANISQANPGDTSVIVNDGRASALISNRWALVSALAIQPNGSPANLQYFEFVQTGTISGNTVPISPALTKTYKTTFPQMDVGDAFDPDLGGPAKIYMMEPSWNTHTQIYGLTVVNGGGIVLQGRLIDAQDVKLLGGGTEPTQSITINLSGTITNMEVDKEVTNLNLSGLIVNGGNIGGASSSVVNLNLNNSYLSKALSGTSAQNVTLSNSNVIGGISAGPSCCGHGNTMVLDNVKFTPAIRSFHLSQWCAVPPCASLTDYAFSNGTLTIAKSNPRYVGAVQLWVPGYKYYMGDSDGSATCTPLSTYTFSALSGPTDNGDGTVSIVTDIPSIPTGNVCNGNSRPPSTFGAYQAMTLTQSNVPAGSANLLSNPEMVPP
jgi:hypothetical protein